MTIKTAVTLTEIQQFLEPKKMAVAGASRDPKKFGGVLIKNLKERGFDLYPVNPNAEEIQGMKCYKSVTDLPEDVKHLLMATPKSTSAEVARQAADKKMEMVWIQLMADTPEAVRIIVDAGIPLIHKKCIYMFAEPVKGPHNFHRFIVKVFGRYPKTVK